MEKPLNVEEVKKRYSEGDWIQLIEMYDDPQSIESNTKGQIDFIDDIGQLHMKWENGRTLAIIPGVDKFKQICPRCSKIISSRREIALSRKDNYTSICSECGLVEALEDWENHKKPYVI